MIIVFIFSQLVGITTSISKKQRQHKGPELRSSGGPAPQGRSLIALLYFSYYNVRQYRTQCSELIMNSISVNQFRDNLKTYVEQTVSKHEPIKVTRRAGEDFIVMSADDWEREQETLHILQSSNLMKQIADSMNTHESNKGYKPTQEQLNEITGL